MMLINFIIGSLITFPLSHVFIKKSMDLDYNSTPKRQKDLIKFFYIPYFNVIISFFYLIWVIIKFKRPE